MEYIALYGLFLAKTLTVVLAIGALLLLVFGLRMRSRQRKGQIQIEDLGKHYRERQREMQLARLGEAEKGVWHKCSDAKYSGLICRQFWTPLNPKKWLFWTVQNCLQKNYQAKLQIINSRLR